MSEESEYSHSLERIAEDKVGIKRKTPPEFDAPSPPRAGGRGAAPRREHGGDDEAAPADKPTGRALVAVVAGEMGLVPETVRERRPVAAGDALVDGALQRALTGLDEDAPADDDVAAPNRETSV